jgi:recombination protein RecT
MAHRYGAKSINAEVIYEGDTFKYHIADGRKVLDEHTQDFQNIDLDKIVGAYCVIHLADGTTYLEVMNMKQIKTAWKKGYGYKENSGTHKEFSDMMAKKTVTSRACKQIVQQYGDVFTVDTFENVESHEDDDKVVADSDYDIQQNANSVDFPEDDVIDAAEDDIKNVPAEESESVNESAGEEIPEFMQE